VTDYDTDILIVGGGLIGVALIRALANSHFRVLLIETNALSKHVQPDFDARSLALSPASVRILDQLTIWPDLHSSVTAIETIHVSQQGYFGKTRLEGKANNPLGYVVEIQHLSHALHQRLNPEHILSPARLISINAVDGTAIVSHQTEQLTIRARLIVAADGATSSVRGLCGLTATQKEYGQCAIVANIGLARAHRQQAYERFTQSGCLALLPLPNRRAALVWTLPPKEAEGLMQLSECEFLHALQCVFGYGLGRFTRVGQRMNYPLRQVLMPQQIMDRVVFIGNAAHTLHPVAGQGFNLGLRDVAMLAQCLVQQGISPDMSHTYQALRRHDQLAITGFTNGLIELFNNPRKGMGLARTMGLMALDTLPVLKKIVTRYAGGFSGTIPDLACGIDLKIPVTGDHS
jgi:2-octaprenyl-6-methoxyphenol hydroxylase